MRVLRYLRDLPQQCRRGFEIPVRARRLAVADVGRQRQHVPVDAVPVGRDRGFEGAYAEGMAKIVKPWTAFTAPASDAGAAGEPDKGLGYVAGKRRPPG